MREMSKLAQVLKMSIRARLGHLYDTVVLNGWIGALPFDSISLTPVFHVEKLHIDPFFEELKSFLGEFRELTGVRAVVTCMTPLSPILKSDLQEYGFDANEYWLRIGHLSQHGVVGLHGHFVREINDQRAVPMHCSFFDTAAIKRQLTDELDALWARGLVNEDLLVYSGGWWFMSPEMRKILVQLGFKWDYSISSSPYNVSQGSRSLPTVFRDGLREQTNLTRSIFSAVAVSSISNANRPYHSIGKIVAECSQYPEGSGAVSLYSHDYDLDRASALAMVRHYLRKGFSFVEPS